MKSRLAPESYGLISRRPAAAEVALVTRGKTSRRPLPGGSPIGVTVSANYWNRDDRVRQHRPKYRASNSFDLLCHELVSTYYECLLLLPKDDKLPRLRDKALASLSAVHRITREAQMGTEVEAALADFDPRMKAVGALNLRVTKAEGRILATINAVTKDMTIDGVREVVMPHDETQLVSGKI